MSEYYCHDCARDLGYLDPYHASKPLESPYQLDKYMKHTVPDPKWRIQSVFDSASTSAYANYVVEASLSGSVEFDDRGRKNVIWTAGKPTGFLFKEGRLIQPQDGVKVVLSTATAKIHAYPANSTTFSQTRCRNCGGSILY